MIVSATEFKTRVGKYLEIADKEEIIITRNGKLRGQEVAGHPHFILYH